MSNKTLLESVREGWSLESGLDQEFNRTLLFFRLIFSEFLASFKTVIGFLSAIATAIGFASLFGIQFRVGLFQIISDQWRSWSDLLWGAVLALPLEVLDLKLTPVMASGLTLVLTISFIGVLARVKNYPKVRELVPIPVMQPAAADSFGLWLNALIPLNYKSWRDLLNYEVNEDSGKASQNIVVLNIYIFKLILINFYNTLRSIFGITLFSLISYLAVFSAFGWQVTSIDMNSGLVIIAVIFALAFTIARPRGVFAGILVLLMTIVADFIIATLSPA